MQRDTAGQQAAPADDFETALQALLDQYRNWEDKTQVAKLLDLYSDVVERDETWTTATGGTPAPDAAAVLELLQPSSAVIGDPDVTLEVIGTGITPESKIFFNGGEEPTTYVDETKVTTIVKPSTASVATTVSVEVHNGELVSNSLSFAFTDAATRSTKRPGKQE
jgi:hypothetical protein